jgi:hypothetical protein
MHVTQAVFVFPLILVAACSKPLDTVEKASYGLHACDAFQTRSDECQDKPEALHLAVLEAKKHGIPDSQIAAAKQLGAAKVKASPNDSPFESLVRRWADIEKDSLKERDAALENACSDPKIGKTLLCRERTKRSDAYLFELSAVRMQYEQDMRRKREVLEPKKALDARQNP